MQNNLIKSELSVRETGDEPVWETSIHPDHHICAGFVEKILTIMRKEAVYD